VSAWKKDLESRLPEVFEGRGTAARELAEREKRQGKLERKIGQLVIEREFLEKKSAGSWD
jgi:hypothetical protein